MALLSLLQTFQHNLGIQNLFACHYNHGLRGAESDADETLVKSYCEKNGIELTIGYGHMNDTGLPKGESIESYARKLRYAFFDDCARQYGAVKIATAHNKNDVVETILFNLTRGTGIKGARGMMPVRDSIIRPLFDISREEIEQYCVHNKIDYATDSTNESLDYARNRIRHTVLPQLIEINNGALDNIARFGRQANEAWAMIGTGASKLLNDAKRDNGYDIKTLLSQQPELARYALKYLIEECGTDTSERVLETAMGLLDGSLREMQVNKDCFLRAEGDVLFVRQNSMPERQDIKQPLQIGENAFGESFLIVATKIPADKVQLFKENSKFVLNNSIDCDRITGNVILRNRRPGDTFSSSRRDNTKSLKKLYNEMGISPAQRDTLPVLSDDGGIVWVMGQGVSRRVAVNDSTNKILHIEVKEGESGHAE